MREICPTSHLLLLIPFAGNNSRLGEYGFEGKIGFSSIEQILEMYEQMGGIEGAR